MSLLDSIRELADCVEARAVYPHELDYVAGLRRAVEVMESGGADPVRRLVAETRGAAAGDYRRGLLKALDILDGNTERPNLLLRLERLESAVESLRTTVVGVAMRRCCMRATAVDLRDDDGTEAG